MGAWPTDGNEAGLCFTDEVGRAIKPDALSRRFQALLRTCDVPRIRLHDVRHTCATLLLKAQVPVHVVSQRLGHASVTTTLNTYAHVLDDQKAQAAETLAAALDA